MHTCSASNSLVGRGLLICLNVINCFTVVRLVSGSPGLGCLHPLDSLWVPSHVIGLGFGLRSLMFFFSSNYSTSVGFFSIGTFIHKFFGFNFVFFFFSETPRHRHHRIWSPAKNREIQSFHLTVKALYKGRLFIVRLNQTLIKR